MAVFLIGLGSNLGERQWTLDEAVSRISQNPQVHLRGQSGWVETVAVGGPSGQPPFLNGAALFETSLNPAAVLGVLQRIEAELGRQREVFWGPRTIDLDLLLFDQVVLATAALVLPHPRMPWRRFVLEPAAEVARDMVYPGIGWTVAELLQHLNSTPWYVALAGSIGAGKSRLARQVAAFGTPALACSDDAELCSQEPDEAGETNPAEKAGAAIRLAEEPDLARLEEFYRDPSGQAWAMELEFLNTRARLLAAKRPEWSKRTRATVSDFWFDQSAAFARVWLPQGRWAEYQARFDEARRHVVRPRLVVLLDVPGDELSRRVRGRGRACEQTLTAAQLERIAQAIREQADRPNQGPVLRISDGNRQDALGEVLAAIAAMK